MHLTFTLTFRILPFGVLKAYSKQGYLGWEVPMDDSLRVWSCLLRVEAGRVECWEGITDSYLSWH